MASGCAVCAATNQCNFAFHNGPGQYCGDWYDYNTLTRKPCCCPLLQVGAQVTCNMTPTQCKCHIYDTNSSPDYNPRPAQTHSKYSYLPNTHHTVWHPTRRPSPVTPLIMILLVVGCCFMCCCRKRHWHNHQHDGIPIATAVGVDASCPPENPAFVSYGSTSSSHHHNHHSGGGGGGNAVASGLGGFAIGTIVGDLIGRNAGSGGHNHHQNNLPMFGGVSNDGGYDIVGDSGDNNFGGYDIQGDSGGYDIQGDSGGYDIQGDS
ncbi:hypothetical protein QTG54_010971 [Skeletonema marinoi]|uniref:Uncharacterized protein n=1 Tax=Skeletonema marinoi TaxID=267567 RepID=A0AAD8Y2M5_9STRA|nr:hypothetical protein QTG54_010971 [Skeletonema marinoi]